jgi:hypothetical protein
VFRDEGGPWGAPCAGWSGSEFDPGADWLTDDWPSDYRVVLLEK